MYFNNLLISKGVITWENWKTLFGEFPNKADYTFNTSKNRRPDYMKKCNNILSSVILDENDERVLFLDTIMIKRFLDKLSDYHKEECDFHGNTFNEPDSVIVQYKELFTELSKGFYDRKPLFYEFGLSDLDLVSDSMLFHDGHPSCVYKWTPNDDRLVCILKIFFLCKNQPIFRISRDVIATGKSPLKLNRVDGPTI